MKILSSFVLVTALGVAALAPASANDMHRASSASASASAQAGAPLSDGEIKKVDKASGKLTIKHGPLANLEMPAMTMVFRVNDLSWLEQVKSGDRIGFIAEKSNGQFVVTRLEIKN